MAEYCGCQSHYSDSCSCNGHSGSSVKNTCSCNGNSGASSSQTCTCYGNTGTSSSQTCTCYGHETGPSDVRTKTSFGTKSSGDIIQSSIFTTIKTALDAELSIRSKSAVSWSSSGVGVSITATLANQIRNAIYTCNSSLDVGTVTAKSSSIVSTWFNNVASYINTLQGTCVCNCNYSCTCNCNYSCTCNCNYCTCNCNYCTCNCNYCTCNCNYCTCNCNYSCTCNCNYCTCNCNYSCQWNTGSPLSFWKVDSCVTIYWLGSAVYVGYSTTITQVTWSSHTYYKQSNYLSYGGALYYGVCRTPI